MDLSSLFGNSAPQRALPGGDQLEETWRNMMYQQIDPQVMQQKAIREGLGAFAQAITAPQGDGTHLDFLGALSQGLGGGANVYNKVRQKQDDKQLNLLGEQAKWQADEKARKARLNELKERTNIAKSRLKLSEQDSAALRAIRQSQEKRKQAAEARAQTLFDLARTKDPLEREILENQLKIQEQALRKATAQADVSAGTVESKIDTAKADAASKSAGAKVATETVEDKITQSGAAAEIAAGQPKHVEKVRAAELTHKDFQNDLLKQSIKNNTRKWKAEDTAQKISAESRKRTLEGKAPNEFEERKRFEKRVDQVVQDAVKAAGDAGTPIPMNERGRLYEQAKSLVMQTMPGYEPPRYNGATYKDPTLGDIPAPSGEVEMSRIQATKKGTPFWDAVEGKVVYKFPDGTFGIKPRP